MKLWTIFAVAVWVLVGLTALDVIDNVRNAEAIMSASLAGRNFRYFVQPFVLLIVVLVVWFRLYVPKREPGRLVAGLVGGYLLMFVVLVPLLVADITGGSVSNVGIRGFRGGNVVTVLYSVIGVIHLAYAFFGPRKA